MRPRMKHPHRNTAIVLAIFAVVFIALTVGSYTRESATWDEPQHLTAGYAALTQRDYRVDAEHPPLARIWAALPLGLSSGIKFDTNSAFWKEGPSWFFCHQFMYRDNNADWMLYRARFMIVLLGVLLGVLLFCWAREWCGFWAATGALALYCLEPNILAHSSLVTTDFALVGFSFGAVYFLWRLTRHFSVGNITGLTVFFVLAQLTKFTAILLWPVVLVLLIVLAILTKKRLPILGVAALLAVATYAGIWSVYGFRYRATTATAARFAFEFEKNPRVQAAAPTLSKITAWVTAHRLLPQAYVEGFLLGQAKAKVRPAYFAGEYSTKGWWYYFPAAFVLKTPLTVIALFLAGLIVCATRWRQDWLFALVPVAVFLGVAMTANINIGLRHILTIYPFVLLLACRAISRRRWLPAVAPVLAAAELALVYPHCIASFNILTGGPLHGSQYLVDSNLDWGQDLKGLKQWMDRRGVTDINLSYFGTADPAYYGIRCTYLTGSPFYAESLVSTPKLPGYVAVSLTNLRGPDMNEEKRRFFEPLLDRKPVARIGHSIHVYWMERPWWE